MRLAHSIILLTLTLAPSALAQMMYWSEAGITGSINRADLDGSNPEEVIGAASGHPVGLAVDRRAGKLYWVDNSAGVVRRANLDGTDIEEIVVGLSAPTDIILDIPGEKMYWTDSGERVVQRANLDGSDVETLVTDLGTPNTTALDLFNNFVYWGDVAFDRIQRAHLDGFNVEDVILGVTSPTGIALDPLSDHFYWCDSDLHAVRRAHLDGSAPVTLVDSPNGFPVSLELDLSSGYMYWIDSFTPISMIRRAHLDGTQVEDIISVTNGSDLWLDLPQVLYVDDDAAGTDTGESWANAFVDLQAALAVARDGDQIWVAAGLYYPDMGTGDRDLSFEVPDSVELYGGFAGIESDLNDRAGLFHDAVLSGNIGGTRSRTVVHSNGDVVIDGFRITGGSNASQAGGVFLSGSGSLRNCTIGNNRAGSPGGGGLVAMSASLIIDNCMFEGNSAEGSGGALSFEGNLLSITNSEFVGNAALLADGGALYLVSGDVHVADTRFVSNTADTNGGAVHGSARFEDCQFIDNRSYDRGGATYGASTFIDCLFDGNKITFGDSETGGALYGTNDCVGCVFLNNKIHGAGSFGAGGAAYGSGSYTNCLFAGNEIMTGDFGGSAFYGDAQLKNCTFVHNKTHLTYEPEACGAVVLTGGSIENSVLWGNFSDADNQGYECVGAEHQLSVVGPDPVAINYSLIQDWNGSLGGVGNFSANPMFVDADGPDDDPLTFEDNDYQLSSGSPAIDAGSNFLVPADLVDLDDDDDTNEPVPFDLNGQPRFFDDVCTVDTGQNAPSLPDLGVVDIGAYEYQSDIMRYDLNGDDLITVVGDLPELTYCYFNTATDDIDTCCTAGDCLCRLDCNEDGVLTIVGDLPCWADCLVFGVCVP